MAEAASLFLRLGGVGSSGDKPATTPSDQRDRRDRREKAINSCSCHRETKETKEKMPSTAARVLVRSQGPKVSRSHGSRSYGLQLSASLACLFVAKVDYYGKIFRYLENFA